jgi:hypothetical protein
MNGDPVERLEALRAELLCARATMDAAEAEGNRAMFWEARGRALEAMLSILVILTGFDDDVISGGS